MKAISSVVNARIRAYDSKKSSRESMESLDRL